MHKPPMSPDLLLSLADRIGVFVFAISGGVLAVRKQMDFLGVIVLAFLPAIGGGTLRDIILDEPVFWLNDTVTLLLAVAGGLAAFFFYRFVSRFRRFAGRTRSACRYLPCPVRRKPWRSATVSSLS